MLTIYNFARGARGVRVAWLCEEMGVPYCMRLVPYPTPPDYRARNPLGQVPFLEDGDVAMTESVAMLLHIAQKYGPTPLLPAPDDPAYVRVVQMAVFSEATLGAAINGLLIDRFAVPQLEQGGTLQRLFANRVEQALGFAEHALADRTWLAGDRFSIADVSVATSFAMWCGTLGGALPGKLADYQKRATSRAAYENANRASA
jgi:glutathione S-transferase